MSEGLITTKEMATPLQESLDKLDAHYTAYGETSTKIGTHLEEFEKFKKDQEILYWMGAI